MAKRCSNPRWCDCDDTYKHNMLTNQYENQDHKLEDKLPANNKGCLPWKIISFSIQIGQFCQIWRQLSPESEIVSFQAQGETAMLNVIIIRIIVKVILIMLSIMSWCFGIKPMIKATTGCSLPTWQRSHCPALISWFWSSCNQHGCQLLKNQHMKYINLWLGNESMLYCWAVTILGDPRHVKNFRVVLQTASLMIMTNDHEDSDDNEQCWWWECQLLGR